MKSPFLSTSSWSGAFRLALDLRYNDVDHRLKARPSAILAAMQEAAILHSENVGRGVDWLSVRGLSWMLVQTRAVFLDWPGWRSRIVVSTWPSEMGRLMSRREFVLSGGGNPDKPLLLGTTLWAFMDTRARRVTRLPAKVCQAYRVNTTRALAWPFCRPEPCRNVKWENRFEVRRWQIDFNGHVNNLRYLDWMLETMPRDIEDWVLRELNIRYENEVTYGDSLVAQSTQLPSDNQRVRRFAHYIHVAGSGRPVASADTSWEPPG